MKNRHKQINNKLTAGPVILAILALVACYFFLLRGPMSTHASLEKQLHKSAVASAPGKATPATLHAAAVAMPTDRSPSVARKSIAATAGQDHVRARFSIIGPELRVTATGTPASLVTFLSGLTSQVKLVGGQIQATGPLYQVSAVKLSGTRLVFNVAIA